MNTIYELRSVALTPIGDVRREVLDLLLQRLPYIFPRTRFNTAATITDVTECYNSIRRQYHSTRLLVLLEEQAANVGTDRILGVAEFDLYVPGLNFVFGEARSPGTVAVVSTYRLGSPNWELFASRVVKEAVHEIGHTLGLRHCSSRSCVMSFSNTVLDTDRKGEDFCKKCSSVIGGSRDG